MPGRAIVGTRQARQDRGHARARQIKARRRQRPGHVRGGGRTASTAARAATGRPGRRRSTSVRRCERCGAEVRLTAPRPGGRGGARCAPPRPPAAASARRRRRTATATLTVTRDYGAERVARVERRRGDRVRHRDAGARPRGRDHDPLRRRLRAVDRRASRATSAAAVASTGSSTSTGSSRRSAPPTCAVHGGDGSGGTTATGRRRCACRRWSAPGRSRSHGVRGQGASRSGRLPRRATPPARRSPTGSRPRAWPASIGDRAGAGSAASAPGPGRPLGRGARADPAAAQIEDGPATSGVFADFEPSPTRRLTSWSRSTRRAARSRGASAPGRPGRGDPARRGAADLGRDRDRRGGRRGRGRAARRRVAARPLRGGGRRRAASRAAAARWPGAMMGRRSPTRRAAAACRPPRPAAAVAYLGSLVARRLPLLEPDRARRARVRRSPSPASPAGARAALAAGASLGAVARPS